MKGVFRYLLFVMLIIVSCNVGDDPPVIITNDDPISNFKFLRKDNVGLYENIKLNQSGNRFYGNLPEGVKVDEMIASYDVCEGCEAYVEENKQEPGVSSNSFRQIKIYKIILNDGSEKVYEVDLNIFTGLPIIYIETDGNEKVTSKDEYIPGNISVFGSRDLEDLELTDMLIRGRGNSTWGLHPKKPYQVKFENKVPFLGMPKDRKWIFLAEYSDKSLLRNRISYEMGYLSNLEWTPESIYAEVFFNGEHQGIYHICQKVEESKNRVNIGDEGFLLEIDQLNRLDDDDVYFYTDHFLLCVKDPDEIDFYDPKFNYVKNTIQIFEDVLFSNNFKDQANGYQKYIDVESVIDWFIINEIAKNVDAKSFASIFMYLVPGEKLKMGPIWDFDLGFGNVNYADSAYPTGFWVSDNAWIKRMMQDPFFIFKLKQRFFYFKNQEEHIYALMDQYSEYLYLSQWENDKIWNTLGVWVWPNSQVFNTYGEEVLFVKEWMQERMEWLDTEISKL